MNGSRTPRVRTLALAFVLLLPACLKSTEPQPSLIQLNGSWNYTGIQTVPVPETLSGTLNITRESGTSFQGRLDLVGVNSQQQQRLLDGSVSGSESGTDLIDFDADLLVETTPRRHVGQIVADTITGTWVSSSGGTMASGTFRVERETR
ncbi:MAG TPA: hypothetical protein DGB72_02995 [Gemmatimonadetes bacterium]|jgi:hypothetical protein|nr:hypothetical protein [Gemmatimonadota bacterium]